MGPDPGGLQAITSQVACRCTKNFTGNRLVVAGRNGATKNADDLPTVSRPRRLETGREQDERITNYQTIEADKMANLIVSTSDYQMQSIRRITKVKTAIECENSRRSFRRQRILASFRVMMKLPNESRSGAEESNR